MTSIRNPIEWTFDQFRHAGHGMEAAVHAVGSMPGEAAAAPVVRRIGLADLRAALASGLEDFAACRADVLYLCVIYPLAGLVLGHLMFGYAMLPLLVPLASGFALVGPVAAIGLYQLSRRREQGLSVTWADAFGVVRAPGIGAILVLGFMLVVLLAVWLLAANTIYNVTLGPEPPASLTAFVHDVIATRAGWAMIAVGCGVGFLFAVLAGAVGVVSFPLLVDRPVPFATAIRTSLRAVAMNPLPMALWGLIVAGALVLGSLPLLLGLIVAMPVLGHATWHLYRKLVV